MVVDEPLLDFRCSHCETSKKSFYSLERQEESLFKIGVRNLPPGLTQKGILNLFLTVGTPIACAYSPGRNHAFVEFKSLNEAELAYRDLHQKPPYNLKIIKYYQNFDGSASKPGVDVSSKDFDSWDFSSEEKPVESREEDDGEKMGELIAQVRSAVGSLGYDPSIRMRQKILDFKTASYCISMGRGYINMGKEDRFVGGLQKSVFSSKNGKAEDMMRYQCENCESATTKVCSNCDASYCSLSCLRESSTDHLECSAPGDDGTKDAAVNHTSRSTAPKGGPDSSSNESFPEVTFTSGCTVLMSSYSSMQIVFLRRTDGEWDDRFARLCNQVALQVMKGKRLQKMPQEDEVVAAKYYEDLCFYRARVLSKADSETDSKISVLFIDFGNTQESRLEDLRPLPEPLRSVPAQALQVHLKDVSEDSSLDSVDYYNALTGRQVPLLLKLDSSTDEVVLVEKDSNTEVNKTVIEKALPSWKRDDFSFSKLGENYFLQSISRTKLEVSKTCSLIISHFDENEFRECEVFWVTQPDSDEYVHVKTRMRQGMTEYCNLLKDDFYLPRVNEVCLAKENDEWHRCVNLQNHKTTCCLFFLDDGHSSFIDTKNIRKMIQDFTEAPSQAVCCILPGHSKMAENEIRSKVIEYLKESVGQRVESVSVLKLMGDGYCLSFPRVKEILSRSEP